MKSLGSVVAVAAAMATIAMTSSSKILLIPSAPYSHVNFFSVAAKALKDAGHDVTIIVNDKRAKRAAKANVTSLMYSLSEDADLSNTAENVAADASELQANIFYKGYYMYNRVMSTIDNYCTQVLGNKEMMRKIEEGMFDLAILDSSPLMGCMYYIPYKYDIRYISMGPFQFPWQAGVSALPFQEIGVMLPQKGIKTTLTERVMSTITYVFLENLVRYLHPIKLSMEFVPEKQPISAKELMSNVEITLVTLETTCFDFPRVSAPNYKFIGSLSGQVSVEPLPENFKTFVNDAKDGLIIISFGSMKGLRRSIIKPVQMLLKALDRVKERAILQFTKTHLEGVEIPENVLVEEWLPQTDLLAHPNTKLFIAHGGLNGHLEATYLAVPILTFPFQPEQERNGARAEAKGYGKLLKWDETNPEEIYQTIREVIDNPSYKKKIQKCASILKDIPSARDQLVFWVNHVIKHGSEHLRPLAADMPTYQFFGIDVFVVFVTIGFVISLITSLITYTCCKFCWSRCCRTSSKQKME